MEDRSITPKLVAGLGNPGREYAEHRHNIGFQVVEAFAEEYDLEFDKMQHKARVAVGRLAGQRVVLAKPLTYMNKGGESIAPLARWYKVRMVDLLVVYDDLDIPLGTLRLRPEGGSGGHRGMRSMIQHLGSEAFPRLRIGIGRPPAGWDPADYVLSPFTEDELPLVAEVRERAVAAINVWLREGIDAAMNQFNQ